jgi:hypothetical protein
MKKSKDSKAWLPKKLKKTKFRKGFDHEFKLPSLEEHKIGQQQKSSIECVDDIPIIKQALFFLKKANQADGIKITDKGFLNRSFVQEFWDVHVKNEEDHPFKPSREFECPEATRIHFLISEAKYVRKHKKTVVLTQRGREALANIDHTELFKNLFVVGLYDWSWGFEDRYPEYDFIQEAGDHAIMQLLALPELVVTANQIFDHIFELPDEPKVSDEMPWSLSDELRRCFSLRFFRRFCLPFGLLENVSNSGFNWQPDDPFRKSKFFTETFAKITSV